ncbi:hypothetical protein B6S44_19050 [Bosea sp. Tri-44]|nr:hypothetical protein B6S44_19050 [Bosea sp. Tri-44]
MSRLRSQIAFCDGRHSAAGSLSRCGSIEKAYGLHRFILLVRLLALCALSAREGSWSPFLAMQRHPKAEEMWALLDLVGLKETGNRIVRELPEGMRKLIDIAVALALEPKLIFMDEPTSGVSSTEKFQVMDTLTRVLDARATTAVFVEHDMDVVARYASRVAVWTGGRIAHQGTPDEILNHPEVRETVIGVGV